MIAAWMLYCVLCALGLFVAAALAERTLLAGRGPVRGVWVGAVALSVIVPLVALRVAPRERAAAIAPSAAGEIAHDSGGHGVAMTTSPIAAPSMSAPIRDWSSTLARFDGPLAIAWITLSIALTVNFLGGVVTLGWMRRRWERRTVLGVPVFVSDRTGPAVVGALAPAIVIPEWVLGLQPSQLALMLRHEEEHRNAGDGRLLTIAQLALIVMPWNLAFWWQIVRLRVAVELDCDARVLREADARSYGDLLLEVARPRSGPRLTGATAFAERATQLERRIRVLSRHRVRTSRGARAVATAIALVAITAAWIAPRPPVPTSEPPSAQATVVAEVPPIAQRPVLSAPVQRPGDNPRRTERQRPVVSSPVLQPMAPPAPNATQGRPAIVDSAFNRLFAGIALTPEQAARARTILTALHQEESAEKLKASVTALMSRTNGYVAVLERDSALRALLTSEADRRRFDANRGLLGGGRRGGGAPRDLLRSDVGRLDSVLARRFDAGGGRAGRGGGAGRAWEATRSAMADATFRRLFDRIDLSAEQEASARALIDKALERQKQRLAPSDQSVRLRLTPGASTVMVRGPADSSLAALLPTESDVAKLRSRLVVVPR
jgi:hypothetical protein